MLTLSGIRAVPNQIFRTAIEQGTIIFELYYRPAIQMWMLDLTFEDFIVKGLRVCNSPDLLTQFSNLMPFGLMCSVVSVSGYEPSLIDDFSSGRVTLNILDNDEKEQIEDVYKDLKSE